MIGIVWDFSAFLIPVRGGVFFQARPARPKRSSVTSSSGRRAYTPPPRLPRASLSVRPSSRRRQAFYDSVRRCAADKRSPAHAEPLLSARAWERAPAAPPSASQEAPSAGRTAPARRRTALRPEKPPAQRLAAAVSATDSVFCRAVSSSYIIAAPAAPRRASPPRRSLRAGSAFRPAPASPTASRTPIPNTSSPTRLPAA